VVLVIGCTLRADRLHSYGGAEGVTPYLDALAAEGTRFERLIANAPWTRPAIAALLTGRQPMTLGLHDPAPAPSLDRGLAPGIPTLATAFSDAGWQTLGLTTNPNASARLGFDRGFDRYIGTTRWEEGITKIPGAEAVDAWLEHLPEEGPLYGQVVLVDAHRPLEVDPIGRMRIGRLPLGGGLLDRYDAALSHLDAAISRLDAGLEAAGRGNRMLVVVGDHGEGLYTPRHAGRAHASWLYDANLHVPWVLHGPEISRGHVVEGAVQGIDVAATLLDLAGLGSSSWGRSLAPAAVGEVGRVHTAEIFSTTGFGRVNKVRLQTHRWTLIHNVDTGGTRVRRELELYRADDIGQQKEIGDRQPEALAELRKRSDRLRASQLSAAEIWEADTPNADIEHLRALGYIEREP